MLERLPEELLERILSYCVVSPLTPSSRPSWHANGFRDRLAPLLVSKTFFRIGNPLFYHTIHIQSASQLHHLLSTTLRPNPSLATHVRRIILAGIWADAGELLCLCGNNLKLLDIHLDTTHLPQPVNSYIRDLDAEDFCEGLKGVKSLTHLMVRKSSNVYLTQPRPRQVLFELAKAVQEWDELVRGYTLFKVLLLIFTRSSQTSLFVSPMTRDIHYTEAPSRPSFDL